jgi:enamine deaminase RidA (YjgF/YER057c/UK114 family)
MIETVQPAEWPRPSGYANGMVATGRQLFVAGQIGWRNGVFDTKDFVAQVKIALENVRTVVAAAGGGPEHVVRLTWFVVGIEEYRSRLREIGAAYREVMGKNFPAMSVVAVAALVEPEALVEIEATAVLP